MFDIIALPPIVIIILLQGLNAALGDTIVGIPALADTILVNPALADTNLGNPALTDMIMGNPALADMSVGGREDAIYTNLFREPRQYPVLILLFAPTNLPF